MAGGGNGGVNVASGVTTAAYDLIVVEDGVTTLIIFHIRLIETTLTGLI